MNRLPVAVFARTYIVPICLQCFDTVDWASGRASSLSDEVLMWLSVCSEAQIVCIWSSWRHCHPKTPSPLALFKSRLVLPFWYRLTQVVLENRPLNGCSVDELIQMSSEGMPILTLDWCWWYLCHISVLGPIKTVQLQTVKSYLFHMNLCIFKH